MQYRINKKAGFCSKTPEDERKEQVPVARYQNPITKEQVPIARYRNAITKLQVPLALENVQRVPAFLGEFISDLKESDCDSQGTSQSQKEESLFSCDEVYLRMLKGTALNLPNNIKPNVILMECGIGDEGFGKDELRLIVQKCSRRECQQQLFLVETTFKMLPQLATLTEELKLESEVMIVKEDEFRLHELTAQLVKTISCKEVVVLGSDEEIKMYKEKVLCVIRRAEQFSGE
ncbi:hypothetical protein ACROYT_G014515 [Oculina patagonica]